MPDAFDVSSCKTTTSTTGTNPYVLDTANLSSPHRTPKQAVAAGILNDGDRILYKCVDTTVDGDDPGGIDFEFGEGVYDDTLNTVSRLAADVYDSPLGAGSLHSWPGSGVRDFLLVGVVPSKIARVDRENVFTEDQTIDGSLTLSPTGAISTLKTDSANSKLLFETSRSSVNNLAFEFKSSGVVGLTIKDSGQVGIGGTAQTNLHIIEDNADTLPTVEIEQLGVGDAGLQLSIVGDSYGFIIDNSDNDRFKLSYAGSAGGVVGGVNDRLILDSTGLFSFPNNVIFGSTSVTPDGNLHIHSGSAGSVAAASTADELIIESSGDGGISILAPDADTGFLVFGSPSGNEGARIGWTESGGSLEIGTRRSSGGVVNITTDNGVLTASFDGAQNFIVGGVPSAGVSAGIELSSTIKAFLMSRMTTTQRNALTAVNGMQIYNTTTNQMEGYINGVWTAM